MPKVTSARTSRHLDERLAETPPRTNFAMAGALDPMGASMTFARNEEIYGEAEPADFVYKVVSGAVRTYKVLNDGRRQIGAFYLPGDMFGLEVGEEHTSSAEAISEVSVLVFKRSAVTALAARDTEIARQLWDTTARELRRAQDHMLLLIKNARERVASFLLDMASRCPGGSEFELPMSRQDMADFLGLTIETVSRTITQLEHAQVIALPTSRRIALRNRAMLSRLTAS
jgi:CRP/FNR family transcriptional regulator, nitrogen fixation regulation protein